MSQTKIWSLGILLTQLQGYIRQTKWLEHRSWMFMSGQWDSSQCLGQWRHHPVSQRPKRRKLRTEHHHIGLARILARLSSTERTRSRGWVNMGKEKGTRRRRIQNLAYITVSLISDTTHWWSWTLRCVIYLDESCSEAVASKQWTMIATTPGWRAKHLKSGLHTPRSLLALERDTVASERSTCWRWHYREFSLTCINTTTVTTDEKRKNNQDRKLTNKQKDQKQP